MDAIISDIHSNLEALSAVFEDIDRQKVDSILCLGDVVGYGPQPVECVDLVRDRCRFVLLGNHDDALFHGAPDFNPIARQAIEVNRTMLRPSWLSMPKRRERWRYLSELKPSHREGDILYCHASPRDPLREYLLRPDIVFDPGKIRSNFEFVESVCFVGHTHQPGVMTEKLEFLIPADMGYRYRIPDEGRVIINVGSVGQPRDGDPRACYTLVDDSEIEFRRVPYDIAATQKKIRELGTLHEMCATRLEVGK
ncbi:MAG: metallophosphoesterase family protein [Planctomycetota bacterium]